MYSSGNGRRLIADRGFTQLLKIQKLIQKLIYNLFVKLKFRNEFFFLNPQFSYKNLREANLKILHSINNYESSKMEVFSDEVALQSIKPGSRILYKRAWKKFKKFSSEDFSTTKPSEQQLFSYFNFLRESGAKSKTFLEYLLYAKQHHQGKVWRKASRHAPFGNLPEVISHSTVCEDRFDFKMKYTRIPS